jgi:polyphosphate kinase 2
MQDAAMPVADTPSSSEAAIPNHEVAVDTGPDAQAARVSEVATEEPAGPRPPEGLSTGRISRRRYEREKRQLQIELLKFQAWVKETGQRVVIVFEGRDAAGKGGTIKRFMEHLNPRGARVVALEKPSETERTQWYFQRYVEHLPAAGEIVLFDRSWYNRAGVERVMGFATPEEYGRFLRQCPIFERLLVEDGIMLLKYWFSVSDTEQQARFESRLKDPMRQWKLSPMDLESIRRWEDYSRAKTRCSCTPTSPRPAGTSSRAITSARRGST